MSYERLSKKLERAEQAGNLALEAWDRAGLERRLRYWARPPFALERLAWAKEKPEVCWFSVNRNFSLPFIVGTRSAKSARYSDIVHSSW